MPDTTWTRPQPLFRFVHARAPQLAQGALSSRVPRVRTYFPDDPTKFHDSLVNLRGADDYSGIIEVARKFIEDDDRTEWDGTRYLGSRAKFMPSLTAIDSFLMESHDQPKVKDFEQALLANLPVNDNDIDWGSFTQDLQDEWRALGDSIIAASIAPTASARSQADLARGMRIVCLLREIIDGGWVAPDNLTDKPPKSLKEIITTERITSGLLDGLILLPADVFPLQDVGTKPDSDLERVDEIDEPLLTESFAATADPNGDARMRVRIIRTADELNRILRSGLPEVTNRLPTIEDVSDQLTQDSASVLDALSIQSDSSVPEAIVKLDQAAQSLLGINLQEAPLATEAALELMTSRRALTGPVSRRGIRDWNARNLNRSPIVGDLHVVQQELLRYEDGEIAHIENVLGTETRGHVHEFKELNEQEALTVTEREEERTHDNQTTDRQEMERETTKESQGQASFQAGATVSASYGAVKLDANTQFSTASSASESSRNASKYSKEVVDRSVERVKERRLEQQRSLTRKEKLDRNEHGFVNPDPESIVGIYRWVDKVYEAATFNYGLRMMLDVTVPEPGAYWQFAKALDAAASVNAKPPPPLKIIDPITNQERELSSKDIGVLVTLDQLAATYRVGGLKPQPPRWVTAGVSLKNESDPPGDQPLTDKNLHVKDDKVKVPKGYIPSWCKATVNLLVSPAENDWIISDSPSRNKYSKSIGAGADGTNLPGWPAWDHGTVGNNTISIGPFIDTLIAGIPNEVFHTFREAQIDAAVAIGESGDVGEEGAIPVTLSIVGSPTFAAAVTIVCERTDTAFENWQLEQYAAVVTQWESWNQEFEAAVHEAANSAKIQNANSTVMNPLQGNAAIATEMRRLFLQMLEIPDLGTGGVLDPADLKTNPTTPPLLHPDLAAVMGRIVQFVEQAFEWPQMTYWLYPYYWKAKSQWPQAIVLENADPAFGDFLRAGSARVVVPVRPGFELAVCHHLGVNPPLPWQAGSPPIIDDEPYLSIAEEIKSAQTPSAPPVRIDTPWPVRLPTSLIHLQDGSDLPVFRPPTGSTTSTDPTPPTP